MSRCEGKLNKYVGNSYSSISASVDVGMKLYRVNQLQMGFLTFFLNEKNLC